MPDAVRIPQAGIVPQTSFRFRLATDTLVLGLHLVVTYPCRGLAPPIWCAMPGTQSKKEGLLTLLPSLNLIISRTRTQMYYWLY